MLASRAPIQQAHIDPAAEEDNRPRSRCGYLVSEAYSCYEQALGEVGSAASGKALHFAADLICSGGLDIWIRGAYSYSIQHIGIASPRIFVYLRQRIAQMDKLAAQYPEGSFYTNPDVQDIICEVVLVIQLCPKRSKVVWPKIDDNAKQAGWLRSVLSAQEARATRAVWTPEADSMTLWHVGNELCRAIEEGASERALFWIRWCLEEDARIKKEMKTNTGLSTKERCITSAKQKERTDAGHFLSDVMTQVYRDLSARKIIRMDEEFAELVRLWKGGEIRMATRLRRDCLGWMAMALCEVPRWKIPAAPTLVADQVRLARAVKMGGSFFAEVLSYRPLPPGKGLKPSMTRAARTKKEKPLTEKEQKELEMQEKFDTYDAIMNAYLNQ